MKFHFPFSVILSLILSMLCLSHPLIAEENTQAPQSPMQAAISDKMPYPSKYTQVLGSKMHYVDSGEGDVFLFLHGNPSSSYLWRNVMPHVAPLGRVIALDLIGFGQSDKPDIAYTFQDHSRYVDAFIENLELKNITLVIHDWGSMLGLDYARRNTGNVRGVAMMEAIIPPAFPMPNLEAFGPFSETFRAFRNPEQGRKILIDDNAFIEGILLQGTLTRQMSEVEKNTYRAPFLNPADREPIYVWPNELPIAGEPARNVEAVNKVGEWLKTSDTPKLLLYVSPGAIVNPQSALWMEQNYKNLEAIFVGYGAHYIQEDNPEAIGRNIFHWFNRQVK